MRELTQVEKNIMAITEQKVVELLQNTMKEFVDTFTDKVTRYCLPLDARYSCSGNDFYMDYSSIFRCYTKEQAKKALNIFNTYANTMTLYLDMLKLKYPDICYEVDKTVVSSAKIGKGLYVYNFPLDMGWDYYSAKKDYKNNTVKGEN